MRCAGRSGILAIAAWLGLAARAQDDPALDRYFAAQALRERGLHDLAARQFGDFLRNHPDHPKSPAARFGLALCHQALGRPAEAEPLLAALRADPKADDPALVRVAHGQVLASLDRPDEAERAFAEGRELAPDDARREAAELGLLEMQVRAARWEKAASLSDRLLRARDPAAADRAAYHGAAARLELGRAREAAALLERLVADRPDAPLAPYARLLLGECRLASADLEGARRAFLDAQEKAPAEVAAKALLLQARAEERRGDSAAARAALERLLRDHPSSPHGARAAVELGRLRLEAGDPRGAREALAGALPDPAARYTLGWVALAEKKEAEADAHFRAALEGTSDPALAGNAALQAGTLALRRGAAAEAERLLERAVEAKGERLDRALLHLGLARARQEKWEPALEALSRVPEGGSFEAALYQRALCERRRGRPGEAARHLARLLSEFPAGVHATDAALEAAEIEIEGKEFAAAALRLEALLSRSPSAEAGPRARYRLGEARLRAGDAEGAARAFEEVASDDLATAALAAHQAGEARLRLKEYERAARHFDRAVEAGERNPLLEPSLLRRAECDALAGRWAESEAAYRKILRDRPRCAAARFGLGWALENQDRREDAIAAYGEALEHGGRSEIAVRARFQRGECHFALGRHDRAVEEFIQVDANYGYPEWSARALLEIGRVLQAQGKPDLAAARYREVAGRYGTSEAAAAARQLLERLPKR